MTTSTTVINPEMLLLLEKEIEKYPTMLTYLNTSDLVSGGILTTSGIDMVSKAISSDLTLVTECFTFLDTLDFLCMFYSGDPDVFVTRMMRSFVATRVLYKPELCATPSAVDTYTVRSADEFINMLENNRPILALIFFSIVKRLFFK